jgi:hypothetical protein
VEQVAVVMAQELASQQLLVQPILVAVAVAVKVAALALQAALVS